MLTANPVGVCVTDGILVAVASTYILFAGYVGRINFSTVGVGKGTVGNGMKRWIDVGVGRLPCILNMSVFFSSNFVFGLQHTFSEPAQFPSVRKSSIQYFAAVQQFGTLQFITDAESVTTKVTVGVTVRVILGVIVRVGVGVNVKVGVEVGVGVAVCVGVIVGTGVEEGSVSSVVSIQILGSSVIVGTGVGVNVIVTVGDGVILGNGNGEGLNDGINVGVTEAVIVGLGVSVIEGIVAIGLVILRYSDNFPSIIWVEKLSKSNCPLKYDVFITEELSVALYKLVYPHVLKQPNPVIVDQEGQLFDSEQFGA